MSKKAFRPQVDPRPSYPALAEVGPRTLARWGLCAVGGLLVGVAACKPKVTERVAGAMPVLRATSVVTAPPADAAAPDATPPPSTTADASPKASSTGRGNDQDSLGVPSKPHRHRINGGLTRRRVEPEK
jgi:hypothetical protein